MINRKVVEEKTDNHKWSIKVVETYKLSDGTIKEKTAAELRIKWKRNGWFYKLKWNILGDKDLLQQHVDIEKVVEKVSSEINRLNKQSEEKFKEKLSLLYKKAPELLDKLAGLCIHLVENQ